MNGCNAPRCTLKEATHLVGAWQPASAMLKGSCKARLQLRYCVRRSHGHAGNDTGPCWLAIARYAPLLPPSFVAHRGVAFSVAKSERPGFYLAICRARIDRQVHSHPNNWLVSPSAAAPAAPPTTSCPGMAEVCCPSSIDASARALCFCSSARANGRCDSRAGARPRWGE